MAQQYERYKSIRHWYGYTGYAEDTGLIPIGTMTDDEIWYSQQQALMEHQEGWLDIDVVYWTYEPHS